MAAARVRSWSCRGGRSHASMTGLLASSREVECVGAFRSSCDGRFRRRRHALPPPSVIVGDEHARVR
jgi:hypothetical protein